MLACLLLWPQCIMAMCKTSWQHEVSRMAMTHCDQSNKHANIKVDESSNVDMHEVALPGISMGTFHGLSRPFAMHVPCLHMYPVANLSDLITSCQLC